MTPRPLLALLLIAGLLTAAGPVAAAGLVQEPMRLAVTVPGKDGDEPVSLEALMVRPDEPGPFPLAVLNHGAPRKVEERRERTPNRALPQAQEFARRGWAALIVMRRGYGESDGPYAESNGPCQSPDYLTAGRRSADDVRAAIRAAARLPYVDARRVISVGISAGGFATVALTADPPPGLVAAISFAGGRGSPRDGEVCAEERLIDAFAAFGRRSRVPMLWVYAENDRYFAPEPARRFAAAFNGAGGRASLVMMPPFAEDGHTLFTREGIPLWAPLVDRFLAAHGLTLRAAPLEVARVAARPPPALGEKGRETFAKYLAAPGHKAFAVSPNGGYGWRTGRRTEAEAAAEAMAYCEEATGKRCRIHMLDDRVME
ncbi:MAG TPA: CocE/NonD family hydrolase [Azospirillum sp.]|nr:CocE/NonD family hydrolase [Azospirillum sp.]